MSLVDGSFEPGFLDSISLVCQDWCIKFEQSHRILIGIGCSNISASSLGVFQIILQEIFLLHHLHFFAGFHFFIEWCIASAPRVNDEVSLGHKFSELESFFHLRFEVGFGFGTIKSIVCSTKLFGSGDEFESSWALIDKSLWGFNSCQWTVRFLNTFLDYPVTINVWHKISHCLVLGFSISSSFIFWIIERVWSHE